MTEEAGQNGTITPDEARALLAEERRQREVICAAELRTLLEKHRCKLNWVEVAVNGKTVETRLQIEAD